MRGRVHLSKSYRRVINSWVMYDWANSAFFTIIVAAIFPTFYRGLVKASGLGEADATAYWAYTTSFGLLAAALLGPLLGAVSDHTGGKKYYIGVFAGVGIVATAMMFFLGSDTYLYASVLFVLGTIGVAGANIFYESLLPHIARHNDIDQISARGYALGYVGGGTLLVLNVLWISFPDWFFLPDVGTAVRLSFLSVAVWWGLFSIPLFRGVPEPHVGRAGSGVSAISAGFRRLARTFREIRKYRQLSIFLLAFWLYNDGIGTIMKMAVAYGDEIGIGTTEMAVALIITQFVGVPCSFGFGWLAGRIGAKNSILLGLGIYSLISVSAFFMSSASDFFFLAFMVGLVQGGTQALSRSLYGTMIPRGKSAEFFGFYSTSSKFAGIAGPLLFGLISQWFGYSRLSILSLVVFFVAGGLLLILVDVEEGQQAVSNQQGASL